VRKVRKERLGSDGEHMSRQQLETTMETTLFDQETLQHTTPMQEIDY